MDNKIIIGWREWLSLPELGISQIKAKIDTGARTSALHAFKLHPFTKEGEKWIRFWVHPHQKDTTIVKECEAKIIDQRMVTDSGGHKSKRYVIETDVVLGEHRWPIEMTLTNRDTMKFRMLLGRTAMSQHLQVDPQHSFLFGRKSKQDPI